MPEKVSSSPSGPSKGVSNSPCPQGSKWLSLLFSQGHSNSSTPRGLNQALRLQRTLKLRQTHDNASKGPSEARGYPPQQATPTPGYRLKGPSNPRVLRQKALQRALRHGIQLDRLLQRCILLQLSCIRLILYPSRQASPTLYPSTHSTALLYPSRQASPTR